MKTDNKPFGNLNFSSYTMETEAERCLLAIQAALHVKGYSASHPTMKKVLRLKRSMSRNKVRRYSFNLVPTAPKDVQPRPVASLSEDKSDLLLPILERITGLSFHSKEAKVASSGHFLVKFVFAGKIADCKLTSLEHARTEVAQNVFQDLKHVFSSFTIQPFRVRKDEEKGRVGASVQCVYRAADATKN